MKLSMSLLSIALVGVVSSANASSINWECEAFILSSNTLENQEISGKKFSVIPGTESFNKSVLVSNAEITITVETSTTTDSHGGLAESISLSASSVDGKSLGLAATSPDGKYLTLSPGDYKNFSTWAYCENKSL